MNAALVSARGTLAPESIATALAIGRLSIGGSVNRAQILAGYDIMGAAMNADAGIGAVVVGRNWIASDLVAGVHAGDDSFFGTDDDRTIGGDTPLVARIASILIQGTAIGTAGGVDHYGFIAEEIGAFRSGGTKRALTFGSNNDVSGQQIGSTGDLQVREVA
jgi:hypothetical protein